MIEKEKVAKPIGDQIIEKTIEKLKESGTFPESICDTLQSIDLTNKAMIKEALMNHVDEEE